MARHSLRPNAREYAREGCCFRFEFILHGPPGGETQAQRFWHDKVCWNTRDAKIYYHALQFAYPFYTCRIIEVGIVSA